MAEESYPFDGADMVEGQWSRLARPWQHDGVDSSPQATELRPYGNTSGMQVLVPAGEAQVRGHHYRNTATMTKAIAANASGSTRVDRVVLRLDPTANSVVCAVKQGTPGAGPPTLEQTDAAIWEMSLAKVTVVNGAGTIVATDVADERLFLGQPVRPARSVSADIGVAGLSPAPRVGEAVWDVAQDALMVWTSTAWRKLLGDVAPVLYGGLTVTGDVTVNAGSFVGTREHAALELGANGVDNNPLIDFHAGRNADYDVRIQATPAGAGGPGLGALGISAGTVKVNGDEVVREAKVQTLTYKTIGLTTNALTGTRAQWYGAMSDDDFASCNGTETLTNKTLTSPVLNNPDINSPDIDGGTLDGVVIGSNTLNGTLSGGGSLGLTGTIGIVQGGREVIMGYGGGGGISIGAYGAVATHPNGVVLWCPVAGQLYARMPGGNDVRIA